MFQWLICGHCLFFFFFEASWASWSVWHCWKVLVGSSEYFSASGSFMKHLKFNQVEHVEKKTRPGEIEIKMEKRRSFERGGQRSTIHWVLAFVFHLWFPGHFSTRKANSFILKHSVGMFWIAAVRNRWCSTAEAERVAKEALNNGELKPVKKNKHKNNKKKKKPSFSAFIHSEKKVQGSQRTADDLTPTWIHAIYLIKFFFFFKFQPIEDCNVFSKVHFPAVV